MRFIEEAFHRPKIGQAPRAVKDGEGAIRIGVNPHRRLDVVVTVAVGRDLQGAVLVAHGVVVADLAFLLNAEDVVEITGEGDERRAGLLGSAGEAGVVARQIDGPRGSGWRLPWW
jgi:hypothetical protein